MRGYTSVLERIEAALHRSQRRKEEVTLIAVTKNRSSEELLSLYHQGVRNFGENRQQELLLKKSNLPKDIHWHFIGTLQKNKVAKLLPEVVLIHSVDSFELAKKISSVSLAEKIAFPVLLQVNIAKEKSKHGFLEEEVERLFPLLQSLAALQIKGLMTLAPFTDDRELIRHTFKSLRLLRNRLEEKFGSFLPELSMGMSQDFEIAIEEGATLLRIGSALFEK